ncbi:MAG: DUF1428 domain-containing protein [Pseudomonadota bacterium]
MYVNVYLLGVPEQRKEEYLRIAELFADVAKDYGAIEIFENWEHEVPDGEHTDFRKAIKAEAEEKVVASWVIWPDRETGDQAHKAMFEDPRMAEMSEMPFDGKRMILGGFEPLLHYRKAE